MNHHSYTGVTVLFYRGFNAGHDSAGIEPVHFAQNFKRFCVMQNCLWQISFEITINENDKVGYSEWTILTAVIIIL